MCNVKLEVKNGKNINFAVYNAMISKNNMEFTIDQIANEVRPLIDKDYSETKNVVKNLIKIWLKSGIVEEHNSTYSVA